MKFTLKQKLLVRHYLTLQGCFDVLIVGNCHCHLKAVWKIQQMYSTTHSQDQTMLIQCLKKAHCSLSINLVLGPSRLQALSLQLWQPHDLIIKRSLSIGVDPKQFIDRIFRYHTVLIFSLSWLLKPSVNHQVIFIFKIFGSMYYSLQKQ